MQLGALARRILKWLRLLIYVPYSLWPTARIQQLTHLPFSIPEAFELLVLNKKTSNRMLKEYYSDKLIYVAGMSKSASHLVEQCIVEILAKSDGKNPAPTYINSPAYMRSIRPAYEWNLRPEMAQAHPDGGVLRSHARATITNLFVLNLLNLRKYFIVTRHPADQLTAVYCNLLEELQEAEEGKSRIPVGDHRDWNYNPISLIDMDVFKNAKGTEQGIESMMDQGYLHSSLTWITDWLRYRDTHKSLMVRYEDFIGDRINTLRGISQFVLEESPGLEVLNSCESLVNRRAQRRYPVDSRIYPKGWTGEVGVADKYFTEKNRAQYLSIVNGFLDYYPGAQLLEELYPDLTRS